MKKFISFFLCFALLLPTVVITQEANAAAAPSDSFNVERECKNGKCIEGLMDLADAKMIQAQSDKCLPPTGTESETAWFEANAMTPDCLVQIKEIEEIHSKLQKVQAHYADAIEDDQEQMCRAEEANLGIDLENQREIAAAAASAACSPAKQREVAKRCAGDSVCALMSSAIPFLGATVANRLIPDSKRSGNCSAKGDNCLVQMGTAFVKSVFGFFGGAWDLLKAAGSAVLNGVKNVARKFWGWVTGAEDKSSTSQLAAAKASKNDGVFQMLKNDFFGTMGKLWSGLVGALSEWLSNDIFCQEWSGTPRYSTCTRPANGIACTNCKTVINGICAISGVIISEVIPAFLTGGLVTAAKYGVSGASKLSKLIRVSAASQRAIKNSSRLKAIVGPVSTAMRRIDRITMASRFGRTALTAIKTAMRTIGRYMLRPGVVALKKSIAAMKAVARTSKTYVMMTPAGPVITFGTKVAKGTAKVVLFPFENAMTVKSFEIGEKMFEKIFQKAGSARLFGGIRPALVADAAKAIGAIDDAYLDMQVTRLIKRRGSEFAMKSEADYIRTLKTERGRVVDNYLDGRPTIPLKNLLDDLYPDLNYGSFSKNVNAEDIRKAESDLTEAIGRMRDETQKNRLIAEFQSHLSSSARVDAFAGTPTFTRSEVVANAALSDEQRLARALEIAKVDSATPAETISTLSVAVKKAHEAGHGTVFNYTYREIKEKYQILSSGGFTNRQSELLIRSGIAGKPDVNFSLSIPTSQTSPPANSIVFANAGLDSPKRLDEALRLIDRPTVTSAERIQLGLTLQKAHEAGKPTNGVYEYSWRELNEKYRILVSGGFSKKEADALMRAGLAGRPPVRELVTVGKLHFSNYASDIVDQNFLDKRSTLVGLIENAPKPETSVGRRLLNLISRPKEESQKIIDNYDSLYFIDYQHAAPELNLIMSGNQKVAASGLATRYDAQAFANFQATRKFLQTTKPEISKKTLLEVHRRMMASGVENVPANQLGAIRDGHWYGNVPPGFEIDDVTKLEIEKNPYLTWVEASAKNGKYTGQIQYPNSIFVKPEGLDIIRGMRPKLAQQIDEYQAVIRDLKKIDSEMKAGTDVWRKSDDGIKANKKLEELKARHATLAVNQSKMTAELVDAMVDQQMEWFTMQRAKLGDLNTPEKLERYADVVAEFQRNLVSIHPLANGNGRSTRELALSYAMMREGFPPPRIIDTNADIYRSLDDWKVIVKHGILSSDFLIDDLIERSRFGLPIENSLELVTPYTRPPIQMGLQGAGRNATTMAGVEYIDPRLYREIIKREMVANPLFVQQLNSRPLQTWDEIHQKTTDVFRRNNVYYKHPKNGIERLEVGFVDEDFKILYGKPSFDNKALFDFKMKTWYTDQVIWRGLASKHAVKTEGEIVDMFRQLNAHMASNSVVGKLRGAATPEAIRTAAIADFEKFNDDVFTEGLVQMARDHSETGPLYGVSYGYSTSKNREVGKAFAMGAMVVGEYGAHKAPELQALLKSRVLVGARRATKDVDLGRLKQLREEFSYKYGRQQEVMGIGASDPDSITIIQTIDADGEVILSYLRNPKNPAEIWVIKGKIDPDVVPEPSQISKTLNLGQ